MSTLGSQVVGFGQGFAVTEHERGIAIVRCSPRGLQVSVSTDGVSWVRETIKGTDAEALQPVCSGGGVSDANLFCADARGYLVPLSTHGGNVTLGSPFQPVAGAPNWYESAPGPFEQAVIRDAKTNLCRTFFCARRNVGRHSERRGCIGVATSRDLSHWEIEPPILAPNRHARLFSPHVLSCAGRTVLFYATRETSGHRALRFALAQELAGPYEILEPDVLATDVRSGIQTVRLGQKILVFFSRTFGSEHALPSVSRAGELDFHADGRPLVRFHDALLSLLGRTLMVADEELASNETLVRMLACRGADFLLKAEVRSLGAAALGILFRTTITGHDNITLWLDFEAGVLSLRRGVRGRILAQTHRALTAGETYRLSLWAEHGFVDVYLDDEWVLTSSTEDCRSGGFGLLVQEGEAGFTNISTQPIEGP